MTTPPRRRSTEVRRLAAEDATHALTADLNPRIRLGASTRSCPGWAGIVWDEGQDSEALLARYRTISESWSRRRRW